jgi:hypothetical protein
VDFVCVFSELRREMLFVLLILVGLLTIIV